VTRKRPERFFNFQTTGVLILGASWSVLYIGLILSKGFNLPTLLLGIAISVTVMAIGLVWTRWLTRQLRRRRER
jgi:branched-subunit amino acid ABC-type transport system permease component